MGGFDLGQVFTRLAAQELNRRAAHGHERDDVQQKLWDQAYTDRQSGWPVNPRMIQEQQQFYDRRKLPPNFEPIPEDRLPPAMRRYRGPVETRGDVVYGRDPNGNMFPLGRIHPQGDHGHPHQGGHPNDQNPYRRRPNLPPNGDFIVPPVAYRQQPHNHGGFDQNGLPRVRVDRSGQLYMQNWKGDMVPVVPNQNGDLVPVMPRRRR